MGPSERDLLEQLVRQVALVRLGLDDLRTEMHGIRDELRAEMHDIRDELRAEMHGIRDELRAEMRGIRDTLQGDIRAVHAEVRDVRRDIGVFTGHFETQRRAISEDVDRKLYVLRTELKEEIAVTTERLEQRVQVLEREAGGRRA